MPSNSSNNAASASGSIAVAPTSLSTVTPAQTVTDVRAFHWSYNAFAAGPYAHLAPVMIDGVMQLTMTSHFLDQPQLERFLADVHTILAEVV